MFSKIASGGGAQERFWEKYVNEAEPQAFAVAPSAAVRAIYNPRHWRSKSYYKVLDLQEREAVAGKEDRVLKRLRRAR